MSLTSIDVILNKIRYHKISAYNRAGVPFLIGVAMNGLTIKGEMRKPIVGEHYRLWGELRDQKGRAEQAFEFSSHEVIVSETARGVSTYLWRYIDGIGYAKAEALVEAFGTDTLKVLRSTPERALEISSPKITEENVAEIRRHFAENTSVDPAAYAALIDMFEGHRFPRRLVKDLLKHWGSDAPGKVRENPYVLLAYPGIGWKGADAWATCATGGAYAPDGIERHKAAIVEALEKTALDGHTYASRVDIDSIAYKLIEAKPKQEAWEQLWSYGEVVSVNLDRVESLAKHYERDYSEHDISDVLQSVIRTTALIDNEALWALPKLDEAERIIADCLANLAATAKPIDFEFDVTGLNEDQGAALCMIRDHGIAILAGAPGTGKSYATAKALRGLVDYDMRSIAVGCPTGKAAKRAAELLDAALSDFDDLVKDGLIPCSTIHRLLGPKPSDEPEGVPGDDAKFGRGRDGFGFTRCEADPIPANFLVIDEASMADVQLAASLLRAVAPGTRVLFVGDPNQLPSVGPGSVLRDMLAAGLSSTTLSRIVRSDGGGRVVRACHAIKDGVVPTPAASVSLPTENWIHLEIAEPNDIARTIVELHESAKRNGNYDPLWDMQVVAAQNSGRAYACRELNERLSALLNPMPSDQAGTRAGAASVGDEEFGRPFRIGDKVVRTKNGLCDLMIETTGFPEDYRVDWTRYGPDGEKTHYKLEETDVVNGDMGIVLDIVESDKDCYVVVRFRTPDRLCRLSYGDAHLIQAYALTCHKMQGSGMPWIIVPVHTDTYGELFTREWLYTAISRAEKLLVTIGPFEAICQAIGRVRVNRRRTRLAERIREAFAARGLGDGLAGYAEGVEASQGRPSAAGVTK
jgi:exodeoxyribonuclease V alpha subunit